MSSVFRELLFVTHHCQTGHFLWCGHCERKTTKIHHFRWEIYTNLLQLQQLCAYYSGAIIIGDDDGDDDDDDGDDGNDVGDDGDDDGDDGGDDDDGDEDDDDEDDDDDDDDDDDLLRQCQLIIERKSSIASPR